MLIIVPTSRRTNKITVGTDGGVLIRISLLTTLLTQLSVNARSLRICHLCAYMDLSKQQNWSRRYPLPLV